MTSRTSSMWFLRAAVSVMILGALLVSVDLSEWSGYLKDARASLLVLAVALAGLQVVIVAGRWHFLLQRTGSAPSFPATFQICVAGALANSFFLSTVGGVVARVGLARPAGIRIRHALGTVVLERLAILAVLVLCAGAGLLVLDNSADLIPGPTLEILSILVFAGFAAAVFAVRSGLLRELFMKLVPVLGEAVDELIALISDRRAVAMTLLLTTISQAVLLGSGYLVIGAMELDLPGNQILAVLAVTAFVSSLPISLGGWGVREGSMVFGLSSMGVPTDQALLASVIIGAVVLTGTLVMAGIATAMPAGRRYSTDRPKAPSGRE